MFDFDKPPIIALDFSGETITSVSIKLVTKHTNEQFPCVNITKINSYKDTEELLIELPKLKYSILVVIPQNDDLFSFATTPLTNLNWHDEVRRKGLDSQTHSINYIQLPKSSLLCAVSNTTIEQLKSIKNATIVPDSLAQIYAYYRNYTDYHNDISALLNLSQTHAQLVVLRQTTLIWSGNVDFQTQDDEQEHHNKLISLLSLSQEELDKNFGISSYDHLIVSGDSTDNAIYELKPFALTVELLNPFRANLYSVTELSTAEKISNEPHKLAILLSAATMALEGIGINLNNHSDSENLNLTNELAIECNLQVKENILAKITSNLNQFAYKTVPILAKQKQLVIVGAILCVILTGCRIYLAHQYLVSTEQEILSEQKKSKELQFIKASYDEYQLRVAAIEARVKAINDIKTNQLKVFTTLNNLNSRLPRLVNLSNVRVTGTTVEGEGWSIDDSAVRDYMTELNSSTVFGEVTPTYQNPEPKKTTFTFRTNYIGSIEAAPLPSTIKKLETTQTQEPRQNQQNTETKTD